MSEVLTIDQISKWRDYFKSPGKRVVLVGGCFDVLHPGHVIFLEKAKKCGDILVVLLESDEKIKKLKGISRPVHNQKERAKVLTSLRSVDFVILLPFMEKEIEYDDLIDKIKPDVIAATAKHPNARNYQRSAKKCSARLKYVTKMIGGHSTSRILRWGV